MNKNQIYNLFSYAGIMLLDNKLIMTSPDYLEEKTLAFLGRLGKDEFIKYPEIKYKSQNFERTRRRLSNNKFIEEKIEYNKIFDSFENDFWGEYCKIWSVDINNYKLMNIINFLLDSNITKTGSFFENFEKYFGDMSTISVEDLDYKAHLLILEYLDENIDFNSRYLKLRCLE